ncbi:DUF4293 domain-containing protein [Roseivirga sp.]|uniref:DUF4293 domain-containing protein n=1 Tax=Roseivirga sp. TaxID=1964215 RepID=UPI003B52812D
MIQRIQTLFLLGVAVLMGMTNAYYLWGEKSADDQTVVTLTTMNMKVIETAGTVSDLSDDTIVRQDGTWYIGALSIIAALIAIFSVLQFRNRLNQMKLGALNALIMAATLGISYYKIYQYEGLIEGQGAISLGFYLPAGAMLLNIIANRFIRKDEKLVKSVDRIR